MKAITLAVLTLASASALAAAPLTAVGITAGVPANCTDVAPGQTFFSASFSFYYDGSSKVMFASQPDGSGDTTVDDKIIMLITHPDGTVAKFKYDYYAPGNQTLLAPKDLSKKFQPGMNQVSVTLSDVYGGCIVATPLWLTAQPADGPY